MRRGDSEQLDSFGVPRRELVRQLSIRNGTLPRRGAAAQGGYAGLDLGLPMIVYKNVY